MFLLGNVKHELTILLRRKLLHRYWKKYHQFSVKGNRLDMATVKIFSLVRTGMYTI